MEISDVSLRLVEVDQDANLAALGGFENRVQEPNNVELGKLAFLRVKKNLGGEVIGW